MISYGQGQERSPEGQQNEWEYAALENYRTGDPLQNTRDLGGKRLSRFKASDLS